MHPDEVKRAVGKGLLAFPVTHFGADGAVDETAYRTNIAANLAYGPPPCSSPAAPASSSR